LESEEYQNSILLKFPKVIEWFSANQAKPPTIQDLPTYHVWLVAKSLRAPDATRCRLWSQGINQIVSSCTSILESVLEADHLTHSLGASLTDIYSTLAESAIRRGDGEMAFKALQILADQTSLAAFRFLSAWTAFNIDQLSECIAECEKVNEPFAPIHTLLGQALLESGQAGDAIDSLKVAAELAPNDPLPLVQLVKAYLVTGIQIEASRSVDRCRKVVGSNIEVECLAAMSIMAGPSRDADFCERTLAGFAKYLASEPTDFEAYSLAMELAGELDSKHWAEKYSDLLELSEIYNPIEISRKVSTILKKTGERQWHDLSRIIIDKTLNLLS
jgi:tetratricopeptide (TPR) repeat protein